MNYSKFAVLCFLLLVNFIKQDVFADKEDKSEEVEDLEFKLHAEENSSVEALGPLDSHEAMNNRDINSRTLESNREKRSYEFLMGLVNNNSKFEVTNVDLSPTDRQQQNKEISVNEAILELIVKIAANPKQWERVHRLLQDIDNDLAKSKLIIEKLGSINASVNMKIKSNNSKELYFEKKKNINAQTNDNETDANSTDAATMNNNTGEVKKIVVILSDDNKQKSKDEITRRSHVDEAIKSNKWPNFEPEGRVVYKPETEPSKYPWQTENKSSNKALPRNFAYHRVTGHPIYHTNIDKNPKAYIAVSVIAPKPFNSRPQEEDLILENELRQLKPWTHKQNLKNMAAIRSRWIIQSDNVEKDKNYLP